MLNHPVLVLNQNHEPINICRVKRAVVLLVQGKAETLENGLGMARSGYLALQIPSVIILQHQIKYHMPVFRLSRASIFLRDNNTCQYCGEKTVSLTIDHVIPRFQGGGYSWDNLITACVECNRKKAGRTPAQAHMKLLTLPRRHVGKPVMLIFFKYYDIAISKWKKYLPPESKHR